MNPTNTIQTITPEQAAEWLRPETNLDNRAMRPTHGDGSGYGPGTGTGTDNATPGRATFKNLPGTRTDAPQSASPAQTRAKIP